MNALKYIDKLNTLREIEEVLNGKAMFSLPYRAGEIEALERRARLIGGPDLKMTLAKINTVQEWRDKHD